MVVYSNRRLPGGSNWEVVPFRSRIRCANGSLSGIESENGASATGVLLGVVFRLFVTRSRDLAFFLPGTQFPKHEILETTIPSEGSETKLPKPRFLSEGSQAKVSILSLHAKATKLMSPSEGLLATFSIQIYQAKVPKRKIPIERH